MSQVPVFTMRALPLWLALCLASACSSPPPIRQAPEMPLHYKEALPADPARITPPAVSDGQWWQIFHDPVLNQLIGQANQSNPGAEAAAARVRQARAQAGMEAAARTPAIDARFGAQRGRASDRGIRQTGSSWQGGLNASYEVDLFGQVSQRIDAASADALASAATHRAIMLALQADVAQTYFRLRATDAEQLFLQETVQLRTENVRISSQRVLLGDLGELELARAQTELETTRASSIALERQRNALEHALATLLGQPASQFSLPRQPLQSDLQLPRIPAGLPSDLLARRPDISATRHAVDAAAARTGSARMARFPSLQLRAGAGYEAGTLADLLKWDSRSWLVGSLLSLPLIDGGRNQARINASEAALDESVANYRHALLQAVAEVEDNLSGLRTLDEQARVLDKAVSSVRHATGLANKLYQAGRSSYLDLLDARRELVAVELSAMQIRSARVTGTIALVRALGGGW